MMFQKIVFQTKILQNFSSILRKTFFLEAEYFCSIFFDTIVYGVMILNKTPFTILYVSLKAWKNYSTISSITPSHFDFFGQITDPFHDPFGF